MVNGLQNEHNENQDMQDRKFGNTEDKFYSHVLISHNFMQTVHTMRKSSLLCDSLCELTNENIGSLARRVNVFI